MSYKIKLHSREECFPFGENAFGGYPKKRYRFTEHRALGKDSVNLFSEGAVSEVRLWEKPTQRAGEQRDACPSVAQRRRDGSGPPTPELTSGFGRVNLYYFSARYYAPWLCRFTSVDPLAMDYTYQSSYVYANNSPVVKIDYGGMGTGDEAGGGSGGAVTDSRGSNNNQGQKGDIDNLSITNNSNTDVVSHESIDVSESTKTYSKGSEEYNKLLSQVENNLSGTAGDKITVHSSVKETTTTSYTNKFDDNGNLLSSDLTQTIETTSTTSIRVSGEFGGDVGGKTSSQNTSENTSQNEINPSNALENLNNESIGYRQEKGKSLNTRNDFENQIAKQESYTKYFDKYNAAGGVLLFRYATAPSLIFSGAAYVTGASMERGLENLKGKGQRSIVNQGKKTYNFMKYNGK